MPMLYIRAKRIMNDWRRIADKHINYYILKYNGVKLTQTVVVAGQIFIRNYGIVTIGNNVRINSAG